MILETPDGGLILPEKAKYDRKVAKGRRKHFTGKMVLGSDDKPVVSDLESHTEMMVAMFVMSLPGLLFLENQVPFGWVNHHGKSCTHHFDFRASFKDGTRVAIIVKAAHRLASNRLMEELSAIASQVTPDFADRVTLITERDIDAVASHNAELLYAARVPEPAVDIAARRVLRDLKASIKVGDIVDAIGREGQGFWAVVRLIRSGDLQLVKRERITHDAMVMRGDV